MLIGKVYRESMSWCVYSCLMQINKCSVLCTTIMRPVVTEAAIAALTIIFPRDRGQCGVCKMREAMLHVSSFNVFMPQLSAGSAKPPRQHVYSKIVYNIGSLPPHHSQQPSQAEDASFRKFLQHNFKLGSQKWHNIIVKCPPFH